MNALRDHNYAINATADSLDVYSCKKCWYKTKLLSSMKPHMLRHHSRELFDCASSSIEMYRCGVCDFETNLMVKSHTTCPVAEFNNEPKKNGAKSSPMLSSYKCEKCNFEASSLLVFIKHVFAKCAAEGEVFKYDESNSIITYAESLTSANNVSHAENNGSGGMENEIKIYKNKDTLFKTETIYMPHASYRCDVCTFYATSLHDLERHKLRKHQELKTEKWFKCSMCKFENKSKLQVEAHILSSHSNISYENLYITKQVKRDKWYCCLRCIFKSKSEHAMKVHCLKDHLRIKNVDMNATETQSGQNDVPLKCKLCPYVALRITAFNRHQYLQHAYIKLKDDWFHCPFCTYRSLVTSQMLTHLQEKHTQSSTPLDPSIPNDNEELVQEFIKFIPRPDFKRSYEAINVSSFKKAVVEGPPKKKILLLPPATSATTSNIEVSAPNEAIAATTTNLLTKTQNKVSSDRAKLVCQGCSFKAPTSRDLKSHFMTFCRKRNVVYECSKCNYYTSVPFCFKDHVEKNHKVGGRARFECLYCPFRSSVFNYFTCHLLCTLLDNGSHQLHKCRHCNFQSAEFSHYNCHVLTNHREFNQEIIVCEYCSCDCFGQVNWKKHVEESHSFKCPHCKFVASNKAALSTHVMNKHTEFCSYCPFTTPSDKKLKEHVREFHVMKCNQCNHVAKTADALTKHLNKHILTCKHCKFATPSLEEMKVHEQKNHIVCPCCPFVFRTLKSMYHHVVVQHDPVIKMDYGSKAKECIEADGFKCVSCSYVCKSQSELSKHIITKHKVIFHNKSVQKKKQQSNELQLNCSSCFFKTNSESALAQHVKEKHGAILFRCEGCPYMHTERSNIEDHVMKEHTNAEQVEKYSTRSTVEKPESESSNSDTFGKLSFTCV